MFLSSNDCTFSKLKIANSVISAFSEAKWLNSLTDENWKIYYNLLQPNRLLATLHLPAIGICNQNFPFTDYLDLTLQISVE
jgi:hypothetical protein